MIHLYGVDKVYENNVKALDSVNLMIEKGEFVFLIGPSGAGKTTLLKHIFREEVPTKGQVIIAGRNIERIQNSKVPFLRRNIGVVFQDFKLLSNKTVYDNVAFALRVTDCPENQIEQKVNAVLELMKLEHKKRMLITQISGGEQQRVCIARALVNNPAILITDEPTGNLDPEISEEIMKILELVNKRGTTIIVATHNKNIVDMMEKRVVSLVNGKIVKDQKRGIYTYV